MSKNNKAYLMVIVGISVLSIYVQLCVGIHIKLLPDTVKIDNNMIVFTEFNQ